MLKSTGDWATVFVLLARAHNYIDALERDGYWRENGRD